MKTEWYIISTAHQPECECVICSSILFCSLPLSHSLTPWAPGLNFLFCVCGGQVSEGHSRGAYTCSMICAIKYPKISVEDAQNWKRRTFDAFSAKLYSRPRERHWIAVVILAVGVIIATTNNLRLMLWNIYSKEAILDAPEIRLKWD